MNFEQLIIILGAMGFNIIFVYSAILSPVRNFIENKSEFLGDMISCPMCFGFWSGVISGLIYGIRPELLGFTVSLLSWVLSNLVAFLSSGSSYYEQMEYINAIEKRHIFIDGEDND